MSEDRRNGLLKPWEGRSANPASCLPTNGAGSFQHMTREIYRLSRMETRRPKQNKEARNLKAYNRRYATEGKLGYLLAWLIGVPIPILIIVFLLRGCH